MCSVQTKGIAARICGTRGTLVWMNGVSPLNEICSAMSHELNRNHFYDGFFSQAPQECPLLLSTSPNIRENGSMCYGFDT